MSLTALIRHTRQNHALEHATVTLLASDAGWADSAPPRIVGRSDWTGFVLYGQLDTEVVRRAAWEGLRRLRAGESWLAVHPRCGTNLAAGALLGGAGAYLVASAKDDSRLMRLNRSLLTMTAALLLARPLGEWIQSHLTTTSDLGDVTAIEVRRELFGFLVPRKQPGTSSGLVVHRVVVVRGAGPQLNRSAQP